LRLPIDERARRGAVAREEWFLAAKTPLDTPDVLAD
jgi:hypothetical protein